MDNSISAFLVSLHHQVTVVNEYQKAGERLEQAFFQASRNAGFEVWTKDDLRQEGFWKSLKLTYGEAIDGMIRIDEFRIPVQIKYSHKDKLTYVKGKFYECLPVILEAEGAPYGMVISNADYETKNTSVKLFCGRDLIDFLQANIQSFSDVTLLPQIIETPFRENQIEIIQKIKNHFLEADRGTVVLPCGYGKTMISIGTAAERFGLKTLKVLVLVPSLLLMEQAKKDWLGKFPELRLAIHQFNGEIGKDRLKQLSNQLGKERYIVISTYHSSRALKDIEFDLSIFDECHRTTGLSDENFAYLITRGNIQKRLFLTATPRIIESDKEVMSMEDESQYGKFLVNKGIKQGIEEMVLSPYEVLCLVQKSEESYISIMVNMCEQAFTGGYSQKIILFAHKHGELKQLEKAYRKLYPNRKILRATDKMKRDQQRALAEKFSSSEEPVILLNCSVYLEGFDVPGCDTVTFYNGTKSVVRIIQGLGPNPGVRSSGF